MVDPRWSEKIATPASFGTNEAAQAPNRKASGDDRWGAPLVQDVGARRTDEVNWPTLTGQNMEGTNNAFDTTFWNTAAKQDDEQRERGGLRGRWDRPDATGLVVYNDQAKGLRFGDVFVDGKKAGNIREGYGGLSEAQADEILARATLPREVIAKAYESMAGKPATMAGSLREELDKVERANTEGYEKGLSAEAFEQGVTERTGELQDSAGAQAGNLLASAAGGAAAGAGLASIIPGVGTIVGGIVGAGAGLVGGWFNRDERMQTLATAQEQYELAKADGHTTIGRFDALSGYAGYALDSLNPTRNVLHGVYDEIQGDAGDGVASYRNSEHGLGMAALDTAALLVDGVGSFGSSIARKAFTGAMGAATAGSVGSVASGMAEGNIAFNPYSGSYEDIGAGGMALRAASTGIDAMQTGAAGLVGRIARGPIARQAAAKESVGGFVFSSLDDGTRAATRLGFSALVPSEAATGLTARMLSRRSIRVKGLENTAENRAIETARHLDNLTTGRKTIATAMVNAFGEASEEAAQAALDAMAFGETPTFAEIFEAARQGAGMGFGMGVAIGRGQTSRDQRYRERSNVVRTMRGQDVLDDKTWAAMSDRDRALEGTISDEREKELYKATTAELIATGRKVAVRTLPELQRAVEVARQRVEQQLTSAAGTVEPSRLMTFANRDWAPEDYVVSLDAAINDVSERRRLLESIAKGKAAGQPVSPEQQQQAAQVAKTDKELLGVLRRARARIDGGADADKVLRGVNKGLRRMWHADEANDPTGYGARRSAAVWGARFPLNGAGSFQLQRLQISPQLTAQGANSTVLAPPEILDPIGGDFDGDRFSHLLRELLPSDTYAAMRYGAGQLTDDGTMLNLKTYSEAHVLNLYDALHRPGSSEHAAAHRMLKALRSKLRAELGLAGLPNDHARRLLRDLLGGLKNRNPQAVPKFLQELATTYAGPMSQYAVKIDGSPYLRFTRIITDALTDFSTESSLRPLPSPSNRGGLLPAVSRAMSRYQPSRMEQSSEMLTALMAATSRDAFRVQTILKYNTRREATQTQAQENEGQLAELIRLFTLLNDKVAVPGERAMLEGTAVQQQTLAWIRNVAESFRGELGARTVSEAMVLLAGAQVSDLDFAVRAPRSSNEVTFVQSVLHQVVTMQRAKYARIINDKAELASRLSSLDAMTVPNRTDDSGSRHASGGDAFVEVFGAVPISELLGLQGAAINNYTVRSLRDTLVNMRSDVRREFESALKAHPSYAELTDVDGVPPFSPYRVLVDNVMESAHQQLHETADGIAKGNLAKSSDRASRDFKELHDSLRALARLRKTPLESPEAARKFVTDLSPDMSAKVLAVMEARGLRASMVQRKVDGKLGKVEYPTWFYDVLAEPSTARAEKILLQNTLVLAYAALGPSDKLNVYRVNDRILRLWLHLDYRANDVNNPNMEVDRQALADFVTELLSPTGTVESFMRMLNTDPRFRDERSAPYIPWARDRAVVEASRYGKGISEVLEGTELRDALRDAAKAASQELHTAEQVGEFRDLKFKDSGATLLSMLREARDNPRSVNRAMWDRFVKWQQMAAELPTVVSASVWLQQAKHINEILGHMGVKGISPDNVDPIGRAITAQLPTFDAAVGRLAASMTSASMGSVLTDMTMLARENRTVVLDDGTVVEWSKVTPEQALDLLSDPRTTAVASRMLGMTAWDYNDDTQTNTLTSTFGSGIAGFVADPTTSLFGAGTSSKLRRLMLLEGQISEPGGAPTIPLILATQMNVREAAVDHVIDSQTSEREAMAVEILEDIADALQALSTIDGLHVVTSQGVTDALTVVEDEDTGELVNQATLAVLQAGRAARRAAGGGANMLARLLPQDGPLREAGEQIIESWLTKFARAATSSGDARLMKQAARLKKDYDRLDSVISPLDLLLDELGDYSDPKVQRLLANVAASQGDMPRVTNWAVHELTRVTDPNTPRVLINDRDGDFELPDLTLAQWERVAAAVIAYTMHTAYGIATTSDQPISVFPPLNKPDQLELQREFWDPTFVEPSVNIFAPGLMSNTGAALSPLLLANIELTKELGETLERTSLDEARGAVYKLVAPRRADVETGQIRGTTGQWHALLPALMHSAIGAVQASAAALAISMAGLNPVRLRMLSGTTEATWGIAPTDDELSTTVIPAAQINRSLTNGDALDARISVTLPGQPAPVDKPLAQLEGRIARSIVAVLPDGERVSLLGHERYAAGLILPASAGVPADAGAALSLRTLNDSLGALARERGVPWEAVTLELSFFHPDTKATSATRGEGQAYSHSAWFDGVGGRTAAAFAQRSLLGGFFFGTGGTVPAAYATALSATKKLSFALQRVTTMPEARRKQLAATGLIDFSGMLHELTAFALKQKIDGKPLGLQNYNAIHKLFELMYVVRYFDPERGPVVLSAEQAMAAQANGIDLATLADVEVVGLPLEHLLELMGEQMFARKVTDPWGPDAFSVNVDGLRQYTRFPDEAWTQMLPGFFRRDGDGWATRDLLDEPAMRNLRLPSYRAIATRTRKRQGLTDFYAPLRQHQRNVHSYRESVQGATTRWAEQRASVLNPVEDLNLTRQIIQSAQAAGMGDPAAAAQMRTPRPISASATHDLSTAWTYVHTGGKDRSAVVGRLRREDVGTTQGPALGDQVIVKGSTFVPTNASFDMDAAFDQAREALTRLMRTGATIIVPADTGAPELTRLMRNHLRQSGYVPSSEPAEAFEPAPTIETTRAAEAFRSTLRGAVRTTAQNRALVVQGLNTPITENAIYSVNGGLGALEDYFTRDVAQTARYAGYTPAEEGPVRKQVVAALKKFLASDTAVAYLRKMSGTSTREEKAEFARAIEDLRLRVLRAEQDPSFSLGPTSGAEFGTGDIIPIVKRDESGKVIGLHLYRHGHMPVEEKIIAGAAWPKGNDAVSPGMRLTIDRATVDDMHTTHRGEVLDAQWLGLQGMVLTTRLKLADLGSKVFVSRTGMKWTTTPANQDVVVPTHPIFAGLPVLGASDRTSPEAKTSDSDQLATPSRIIEAVGFDAEPFIIRALKGVEYDETRPDEYARARAEVLQTLREFRRRTAGSLDPADAVQIDSLDFTRLTIESLETEMDDLMDGLGPVFQEGSSATADLTITRLVLTALMTGARESEALSAPGFIDRGRSAQSHTMHPVFTTLLHKLPEQHPARLAFVQQINDRMPKGANGIDGYTLLPNFSWLQTVAVDDGVREEPVMLAFSEVRNTDHNDALAEMAASRRQRGGISPTTNAMGHTTWDVSVLADVEIDSAEKMFAPNSFLTVESEAARLAFNRGVPETPNVTTMQDDVPETAAELRHIHTKALPTRRALSVPIDTDPWFKDMRKAEAQAAEREYRSSFDRVLRLLRLTKSQSVYLTEMIRTVVARPALDDGSDYLTLWEAKAALKLIEANANEHLLPTYGGAASTVSRAALKAMYNNGYPLKANRNTKVPVASWDDWVDVVLGHTFSRDPQLRGYVAVSNIIDGLLYEYRKDVVGIPATISDERQRIMTDYATRSGLLLASPVVRRNVDTPSIQGGREVTQYDDFEARDWEIEALPGDARALVEERMVKWEKKHGLKNRRRQSPGAEAIDGALVREDFAKTNMLLRYGQLWMLTKTLLSPGLWVGAFLELADRGGKEKITSLLTGESVAAMRITGELTAEQAKAWKAARDKLASHGKFGSDVNSQTFYVPETGGGRFEHAARGAVAKLSAVFNDPTWGLRNATVANRFMESAWSYLNSLPLDQHISLEQFLDTLATNPDGLAYISPDAVEFGYRRIEYSRGLHDNMIVRMWRSMTEGVIGSGGPGANTLGTLFLRWPTLFLRFGSNFAINMLGAQAPLAILSTIMSERTKRPGGLLDRLTGQPVSADPETTDLSALEDSIDLTRAIVRSGVSMSNLFIAGSLISAAGFGGGDDDEQKLLNKLRKYQRTPVAQDPLSLKNDFRNADAWFTNLLPGGMGTPSWVLKIFTSPIMGMARFKETGDFRQVLWGFQSAMGNLPVLNIDNAMNSWQLANELVAAAEAADGDSEESASNAAKLAFTAVATLEGMLFESAFASMIYQASDEFDRDPFLKPLLDSDGNAQVEGAYGTPRKTDVLQEYVDENGEVKQAYVQRTDLDAKLHGLAENRPFLATVLSLIMNDRTFIRYNQPVKTREIKSDPLTTDEAKAFVVSVFNNEMGREELTVEGAEGIIRGVHMGALKLDSPALKNVAITGEQRAELAEFFLAELTEQQLNAGKSKSEAVKAAKAAFYGQEYGEAEGLGIADIIYSDAIPYHHSQKYMQLNTTYVMGPTGRPVATGLQRSVLGAVGFPTSGGILPFEAYHDGSTGNLSVDQLMNSVDPGRGVNLGMRGLIKVDETWNTPTDEEIGKAITDAIEKVEKAVGDLPDGDNGGKGWKNYKRGRGWSRGGYGSYSRGYSSAGYTPSWGGDDVRVQLPRRMDTPRLDDLYSINTSSAIIRRATIRRERFSSERGRLNQWQ